MIKRVTIILSVFLFLGSSPLSAVGAVIRTPKVAGQFYPSDPKALKQTIQSLFQQYGVKTPPPIKPKILIVPHAGYPFSGPVAARAFSQLIGQHYDGVVVVGFTHRGQFPWASVDSSAEAYETPLGEIPVHQEAVSILQSFPRTNFLEAAHESEEHSLEVELPFLQEALGRFRLVPILLGSIDSADAERLASQLAILNRLGDYLFVFSTDLSHYHPYDEAVQIDRQTVNAILTESPQAVSRLFENGQLEACGRGPILTALWLARKLGYLSPELLFYANSGDTTGEKAKVVGYSAIAMRHPRSLADAGLSRQAGLALVKAARQVIEKSLGAAQSGEAVNLASYPELSKARGLFVTLRKQESLRGCIGRVQANEPLSMILPVVALDAATHDPRFSPVVAAELEQVAVEVSVLTEPVKVENPADLVPSRDGVILEYRGHTGVFLPQVWDESGWTRLEFLQELAAQKAGLPPDSWQKAALYAFQAQVFSEPSATQKPTSVFFEELAVPSY